MTLGIKKHGGWPFLVVDFDSSLTFQSRKRPASAAIAHQERWSSFPSVRSGAKKRANCSQSSLRTVCSSRDRTAGAAKAAVTLAPSVTSVTVWTQNKRHVVVLRRVCDREDDIAVRIKAGHIQSGKVLCRVESKRVNAGIECLGGNETLYAAVRVTHSFREACGGRGRAAGKELEAQARRWEATRGVEDVRCERTSTRHIDGKRLAWRLWKERRGGGWLFLGSVYSLTAKEVRKARGGKHEQWQHSAALFPGGEASSACKFTSSHTTVYSMVSRE